MACGSDHRPGREDPRREEITTEAGPREDGNYKIVPWAVPGPSDAGDR